MSKNPSTTPFLLVFVSLVGGCAPRSDLIRIDPKIPVEVAADSSQPLHKLRTFSAIPLAETAASDATSHVPPDPLLEKMFLAATAEILTARGYEQVSPEATPDFAVFVQVTNEYRELYVPPRQVTVPIYLPGTTSTTYSSATGRGQWHGHGSTWTGSSYGSYSSSGYGTASAYGTSTTSTSGRWTTGTKTVGGYTVGYYYPSVVVQFSRIGYGEDAQPSLDPLWRAAGTFVDQQSNIKLYGHFLLGLIADGIPCQGSGTRMGRLGVVMDQDYEGAGVRVLSVFAESAAHQMGLRSGDTIERINGEDVPAASRLPELLRLHPPGSPLVVEYKRGDETYQASATLVDMPFIDWR